MEELAHADDSTPGTDEAPLNIAKRARPSSPLAGSSGSQSLPRTAVAGPHLTQRPGSTAVWGPLPLMHLVIHLLVQAGRVLWDQLLLQLTRSLPLFSVLFLGPAW